MPRERWRRPGSWKPLGDEATEGESSICEIDELEDDGGNAPGMFVAKGRRRGECAGVANGVCSGVELIESCEKEGDEGAVDCGERMEWREGE